MITQPAPFASPVLRGLGISATPVEAIAYARAKLERRPTPWTRLDYLSIGVSAREELPPELPSLLREAHLQASAHLLEVNLVRPIAGQRETMAALYDKLAQLSPANVEEDAGFWTWGASELEQHMLPPIFDDDTALVVARNAAEIQRVTGLPFYVENPPVYCDLGSLDVLAFMERVADRSGCGLVLDIGHLVGYCAITGREPDEYLDAWTGIHHVRELHIAGYSLLPDGDVPLWYDDHAKPISEYAIDLAALAHSRAVCRLPVTLEQEGATHVAIADHIHRVSRRLFS